jgi:hypothetical protein
MARPKKVRKAMVTWLGEDHLHEDGNGPRKNEWRGITFPKGEPVQVSDPQMIEKAKANPFYEVSEGDEAKDEAKDGEAE